MGPARIVMHVHSEWSYDGSWALADISRLMSRLGADIVMMSEHDDTFDEARFAAYRTACAEASRAGATLVPGIEYSSPDNAVHILAWGLTRFHGTRRPVMEILRRIADEGGVAVLAHPARREAFAQVRDEWVPYLSAIEIWNRKTDGLAPGREALALVQRFGLPATAGMDFHRAKHLYPVYNRADVSVSAASAEATAVAALRRGGLTPMAFGLPIVGPSGRTITPAVQRLSALDGLRARRVR